MNLNSYISDLKLHLQTALGSAIPVVDGPVSFAKNTQGPKSFVCVSEGRIGYESYSSPKRYAAPIDLNISINVEKSKARNATVASHVEIAREWFALTWAALSGLKLSNFQVLRVEGERMTTDDPSEVEFVIRCTLETTEYETCS
jgi:hypothetical protein